MSVTNECAYRHQLSTDNSEYEEVSAFFLKSAKGKDFVLSIEAIEKVNNHALQLLFDSNKANYKELYGDCKIVKLFHGTKCMNIPSIVRDNFNISLHGRNKGRRLYGAGVNFTAFAASASYYCDEDEQVKQMLLCSVLVSNILEVPEATNMWLTLTKPPYIQGTNLRYDTTARNKKTMDVIVKYEDHTFYPAFVISFRKHNNPPVQRSPRVVHDIVHPPHNFFPEFRPKQ
ncbi:uncharacterized protein LOC113209532 [Frankliniella occidentalis]|uniref:Poly [ADP-ribose] polymerase n=1 Tax=Frankliniella occidentalis TaxID=133901 RepID=A0A6J1SPN7_FRAOC|nr:uncharacterized protein LOC113209532 [Frankliniella occidentalis]